MSVASKMKIMYSLLLIAVISASVSLLSVVNVSTSLNASDIAVFQNDLHLAPLRHPQTFADEIAAIKLIQQRVIAKAPDGKGIPMFNEREPSDLLKQGEGSCYDRSRTLDKAMTYIGLPVRHVYLLYRGDSGFLSALLHYGQQSHAVTEVKTSNGWMFVDSNSEWIALTRDGHVVNADDVWKRAGEFENLPEYLDDPWWAIRGMYSRTGHLYPPYTMLYTPFLMFPDVNWGDFFSWLIYG